MRANEQTEERVAQYPTRRFHKHSIQCAPFAHEALSLVSELRWQCEEKQRCSRKGLCACVRLISILQYTSVYFSIRQPKSGYALHYPRSDLFPNWVGIPTADVVNLTSFTRKANETWEAFSRAWECIDDPQLCKRVCYTFGKRHIEFNAMLK